MRYINFRGLAKDTGKWKYGGITTYSPSNEKEACLSVFIKNEEYGYLCNNYFVDPKTVGQCVIKKDRNNKEIYEGDKLLCHKSGFVFIVKYDDNNARFYGFREGLYEMRAELFSESEIIGNIHEEKEINENTK